MQECRTTAFEEVKEIIEKPVNKNSKGIKNIQNTKI